MSMLRRNYQSVQYAIWIVDNDITQSVTVEPLKAGVWRFLQTLAPENRPPVMTEVPMREWYAFTPVIHNSLVRLERWHFERMNGAGESCRPGNIDVLVYYFDDWEPLTSFLRGEESAGERQPLRFWPSVVVSDLYDSKQAETMDTSLGGLRQLAGYKFADECQAHRIPFIAITSHEDAFTKHQEVWQSRPNVTPFFHASRQEFGRKGEAYLRLAWDTKAVRLFWIPEFKYELEGLVEPGGRTYTVRLLDRGKVVSLKKHINGTPYAQLYVSAWGGMLALAKGYQASEIAGWATSQCLPVCIATPNDGLGSNAPQPWNHLHANFAEDFPRHSLNFYFGGEKQEGYKILDMNIVHLDVPPPHSLPSYYSKRGTIERIVWSLRMILPPDGLAWLEQHLPKATAPTG